MHSNIMDLVKKVNKILALEPLVVSLYKFILNYIYKIHNFIIPHLLMICNNFLAFFPVFNNMDKSFPCIMNKFHDPDKILLLRHPKYQSRLMQ